MKILKKLSRNIRYDLPLHFVLLLTNWLPNNTIFLVLRGFLASFFFRKCGKNLRLGRHVNFYNPSQIVLGNDVYIAYYSLLIALRTIELEDEILLGPFNVLVTGQHEKENGSYRWGKSKHAPIRIGRGSWLGSHVTVVGGVSIGKGSLVGANSVVTKNVEDDSVIGGVPARTLKTDYRD